MYHGERKVLAIAILDSSLTTSSGLVFELEGEAKGCHSEFATKSSIFVSLNPVFVLQSILRAIQETRDENFESFDILYFAFFIQFFPNYQSLTIKTKKKCLSRRICV